MSLSEDKPDDGDVLRVIDDAINSVPACMRFTRPGGSPMEYVGESLDALEHAIDVLLAHPTRPTRRQKENALQWLRKSQECHWRAYKGMTLAQME